MWAGPNFAARFARPPRLEIMDPPLYIAIQKAYDTMWRDGLWYKLWDMGVKGRMWHVIKKRYVSSRSGVLLEGRNWIV